MKKSKLLTATIVGIIFLQLFTYSSLIQVKGCAELSYITASIDPTTVEAPGWVLGTATAFDIYGDSMDISTLATWSIPTCDDGGYWSGNIYTSNTAGTYTVQALYEGMSATVELTVTHATDEAYLSYIIASIYPTTVAAPNIVTGTATAYDSFGNSWDISTLATWSIPAENDGGFWTQNVYTSHLAGTYTVQATYWCISAWAILTVTHSTDGSWLTGITISPLTSTIAAGSTQSYTATATDSFGNSWDVTGDISNAKGWSISSGAAGYWNGATYTSQKAGAWTVTGTYLGKIGTANLIVTHSTDLAHLAYIAADVIPTSVAAPNIAVGNATAYDSFGNNWDISTTATWSIPAGGDGGSWLQNIYTSKTAGTYTVQASYQGKTATCPLTVTHATNQTYLDHITIAPKTATVNAGISQSFIATAYDTFGNNWTVIAVYSCPNANLTINGNSAYSNTAGTYTITGTYNGKTDAATLTVTGHLATVVSIGVSPKTATITAGNSQTFIATASDGYNTWDITSQVTWSINIAAGGSWNQTTGTYTSANTGNWSVMAALNALSDTATLIVNANSALLNHIIISPKTATVAVGTPQKFNATAYDQLGNSLGDVTSLATFSSPGASVTGNSVKANIVGSYTVTATYNGLTDAASLTVAGYTATFTEKGLQTGISWTITFGGHDYSSATNTITINGLSAQSYSWNTASNIQNGQTRFTAAQISGALTIPSQLTQNIDYSTQYLVTYSATGNALYVSVPPDQWVNSSAQATGSFPVQIVNGALDSRCNFLSDNRPAIITQPTTITGTYQTQYFLTVTSPHSTTTGTGWYNDGSTVNASIDSATIADAAGTKYTFTTWTGDASGSSTTSNAIIMNSPKTATANWKTQYYLTTTSSYGSINGAGWYDSGSTATATLSAGDISGGSGIQRVFNGWSGDASGTTLTTSILMTGPKTASASWKTQYLVTYASAG